MSTCCSAVSKLFLSFYTKLTAAEMFDIRSLHWTCLFFITELDVGRGRSMLAILAEAYAMGLQTAPQDLEL